ncbi:transporter substrate-binding domain-containing protein [Carnobacteriaceae bacterium zg-C25]|nr:transporter substrate-binding domain-containing protein [Carnobacteriaceae bacterium zg-C25]
MKKFKLLLSVATAFLLAACSTTPTKTQTTWQKIEAAGTIKVATPGTLYPTSYKNDQNALVGYEIDMMNEIAKRLNLKVEYTEIGVAEALTSVDSGKVDISINNFTPTKERAEKYNLSESYKYSIGGMIVRADDSSNITATDLSDWKGKKAGGGAGTTFMKITKKLGGEPVIYDNVTNDVYLRDVSTGRTDFVPNDYFTQVIAVKLITEKFPDIKVKMGNVKYNPSESVIIMSKTDTSLKEKIDGVIAQMKADGTLKAISEKYYAGQDLSKPLDNVEQYPVVDFSDVE